MLIVAHYVFALLLLFSFFRCFHAYFVSMHSFKQLYGVASCLFLLAFLCVLCGHLNYDSLYSRRSDLPQEDGSPTVLLLGVTRIPTSPPPRPRRPRSLALVPNHNQSKPTGINVNPSNNSQPTRARPVSVVHPYTFSRPPAATPIPERELAQIKCGLQPLLLKTPSLVADASESSDDTPTNASGVGGDAESPVEWSSSAAEEKSRGDSSSCVTNMERSVDSIGACSLDVDASAELLSGRKQNNNTT